MSANATSLDAGSESESIASIAEMMRSIMTANKLQAEQMAAMRKDLDLLREHPSTIVNEQPDGSGREDSTPNPNITERVTSISEGTGLSHHSISEANKRHFLGKKFDSGTEEVLEWADYFRGYLNTHTWDIAPDLQNMVALRMLGEALAGSIEQFWFAEVRKTKKTCREILEELEDNFTPDHERQQAGSIEGLRECKQKDDENTKVYLLRFERALARHRRAMAKKRLLVDDIRVMQALYAGVKSPEVAKGIKKANSLVRAIAAAKTIADEESHWSYLRPEDPDTTKPKPATAPVPKTVRKTVVVAKETAIPQPPPSTETNDTAMAALMKGMEELRIMISRQQGPAPYPRAPGAPRSRATKTNIMEIMCYNCGEKGHYSNDCPKPPTKKTLLAGIEYYNHSEEPEAESFLGSVYLTEEDYREYTNEQYLREQDFYPGW
ncbi:hypothetical protein BGX24_003715 [Mortierella sp. AD032]|nr:hypothetical protein BGX24_003715 [Mortierella sp. AD032]